MNMNTTFQNFVSQNLARSGFAVEVLVKKSSFEKKSAGRLLHSLRDTTQGFSNPEFLKILKPLKPLNYFAKKLLRGEFDVPFTEPVQTFREVLEVDNKNNAVIVGEKTTVYKKLLPSKQYVRALSQYRKDIKDWHNAMVAEVQQEEWEDLLVPIANSYVAQEIVQEHIGANQLKEYLRMSFKAKELPVLIEFAKELCEFSAKNNWKTVLTITSTNTKEQKHDVVVIDSYAKDVVASVVAIANSSVIANSLLQLRNQNGFSAEKLRMLAAMPLPAAFGVLGIKCEPVVAQVSTQSVVDYLDKLQKLELLKSVSHKQFRALKQFAKAQGYLPVEQTTEQVNLVEQSDKEHQVFTLFNIDLPAFEQIVQHANYDALKAEVERLRQETVFYLFA